MTDNELVLNARKGNQSAYREIVRRHQSRVAATVYGMLGNCQEAEDIGQETFIRLFNSLNSFRGDSSLSTYITRIAINLSLNELKRRKRRSLFFIYNQGDVISKIADQSNDAVKREKKEMVDLAIQQLEPKYKAVLVLRMIDGYSTEETAKILQLPAGTVLSRLSRAQQKLKTLLIPILEGTT